MTRFYQPDLGSEPDSSFARDASDKLVRRSYWLDMNDRSLILVMTQGIGAHLTNDEKLAHLSDLKREHLIDQICVQEILPLMKREKCCPTRTVAFPQLSPQKSRRRPKKQHNSDKNQFRVKAPGTLPRHSVFVRCAAAIWGGDSHEKRYRSSSAC
jgi:hypothetical protein